MTKMQSQGNCKPERSKPVVFEEQNKWLVYLEHKGGKMQYKEVGKVGKRQIIYIYKAEKGVKI